jgi:hypothetical protein
MLQHIRCAHSGRIAHIARSAQPLAQHHASRLSEVHVHVFLQVLMRI